jgi:hypothetical protein
VEKRLSPEEIRQMRSDEDRLFPDPLLRQNIPLERLLPDYMVKSVGDNLEFPQSGQLLSDLYEKDATRLVRETITAWADGSDDVGQKYHELNRTLAGWGALRGHPNMEGVYEALDRQGVLPDLMMLFVHGRGGIDYTREYLDRFIDKPAYVNSDGPYKGGREPVVELGARYLRRNFDAVNRDGDSLVTRMGLNPFRERDKVDFPEVMRHWRKPRPEPRSN